MFKLGTPKGSKGTFFLISFLEFVHFSVGNPIVDIRLFPSKGYWCFPSYGQGKVPVKGGKSKRRGNPSFWRRSASHGHSIKTGVPKVCLNMFRCSTLKGSKGTVFN